MTYYINLGGILLYGIKSVNDDGEREITSYDGIGQGFFPVPESRKLRTWTIECEMTEKNLNGLPNWSAASKVFTAFEVLLATKDPSRFIFVSDNRSESMSGYLTGYSKKEEYPGVYSVTVKVTEYKEAGVKTTDVPYVKRPGKAPATPKVVVFNSKHTPYKDVQDDAKNKDQAPQNYYITNKGVMVLDPKTGKYVLSKTKVTTLDTKSLTKISTGEPVKNLSAVIDGTQYMYDLAKKGPEINSWFNRTLDAISKGMKTVGSNI